MFAIEFQAKVTNGTIDIPESYRKDLQGPVRVILLAEEKSPESNKIAQLLAEPLTVEDFTPLTREQAHERA